MRYIKITCSNGFCGCDETWYEEVEDDFDIDTVDRFDWLGLYDFSEPDDRFLCDYETDEEYEEACDEYQDNLECMIEEITKEEYEENA